MSFCQMCCVVCFVFCFVFCYVWLYWICITKCVLKWDYSDVALDELAILWLLNSIFNGILVRQIIFAFVCVCFESFFSVLFCFLFCFFVFFLVVMLGVSCQLCLLVCCLSFFVTLVLIELSTNARCSFFFFLFCFWVILKR